MLIFLCGYMGSGKSTVGQTLASRLNFNFVDTDLYIQEKEGLSISEIFEYKGEEYFRQLESKALSHFKNSKNTVISTGGGMVCFHNNINFINKTGQSFYLHLSSSNLVDRLIDEKNKRPIVSHYKDKTKLLDFINSHLLEREAFYFQANFIVDGNKNVDEIVDDIIELSQL